MIWIRRTPVAALLADFVKEDDGWGESCGSYIDTYTIHWYVSPKTVSVI